PDRLICGVTKNFLGAAIPTCDHAIEILGNNRLIRAPYNPSKKSVWAFELLAVGDIDDRADVAEASAISCDAGNGRVDHPAVLAVPATQPVLQMDRCPLSIGLNEGLVSRLLVVRMQRVDPAEPETRFGCLARELIPGLAEKRARRVGLSNPNHQPRLV